MFYRRWTPAGPGGAGVPWRLEAYSWGGLTESPLASASWLLLAPFMLYNVAHFALPPQPDYRVEPAQSEEAAASVPAQRVSRDRWHALAAGLLRLLGFSATLQFAVVTVSILVSTVGLQAPNAHFPSWLLWYRQWAAAGRVALALGGVAVIFALLWVISVVTARRYEGRVSDAPPRVEEWPLTQTRFWKGRRLVQRQRSLHIGGALAITALIVSRPAAQMGGGRLALLVTSAFVLALIAVSLCLPLADRHHVTLAKLTKAVRGTRWCRLLLAGGVASFAGAFFTSGWPAENKDHHLTLPGFTSACAFLLAAQALLLVVLALVVWKVAHSAPSQPEEDWRPFARGHLTTILAVLAVGLGGVFSAVIALFATRLLGTPVPSGTVFTPPPHNALEIPWPIYAFGAVPVGLLIGILIAAAWIAYKWWRLRSGFAGADPRQDTVTSFYQPAAADSERYQRSRKKIAGAWAVGRLADSAAVAGLWAAAGMVAAMGWAVVYSLSSHVTVDQQLHGFAALESLVGLFAAGVLVGLLRSDYSNPARRKTIGALWDVGTFWPRATHPLAPPCYAERAVPELVDRIRILTGTVAEDNSDPAWCQIEAHRRDGSDRESPHLAMPTGKVLLTGYSQGSIIAPAVVAQLPDTTRDRTALLTLACPARRLYGRAFPAYFGERPLRMLLDTLSHHEQDQPTPPRWKNLVRRTDYIGSWIFRQPGPAPSRDDAEVQPGVDQPCWDPVTMAADLDPTPPPIHYHSGFWPDPRVTQLGRYLGEESFP